MHDLAIIGAGPVGSYLASLCGRRLSVRVIEKNGSAGGKACSGLVSRRAINLLPGKVTGSPGVIEHKVRGAIIHIMGNDIELKKNETAAYVINRPLLDRALAEHAASCGADVSYGISAVSLSMSSAKATVLTNSGAVDAQAVAGCDGALSVAARWLGSRPYEVLNGVLVMTDEVESSDCVELWFDKRLSKDGFLWRIPHGARIEYGGMGSGLRFEAVERFFRLAGKGIIARSAAPIPIGIVKTFGERVILVGDAACQTKPWSGGGITYGLLAAKAASEILLDCFRKGDLSVGALAAYEERWKAILMKDISAGLAIREIYKDLDASSLTSLIGKAPAVASAQESIDFDFPFTSLAGIL